MVKKKEGTCGKCLATQSITWRYSQTGTKVCQSCYFKELRELTKKKTDITCASCSTVSSTQWYKNTETFPGKNVCEVCYRAERSNSLFRVCGVCHEKKSHAVACVKYVTSDGLKDYGCKACVERKCAKCGNDGNHQTVCVPVSEGYACRTCVDRKCDKCGKDGNHTTVCVPVSEGYACKTCVDRKCDRCGADGNHTTVCVPVPEGHACNTCVDRKCDRCGKDGNHETVCLAVPEGHACRTCVIRKCVICEKEGNCRQVNRLHPDGEGYCHNTIACYGLHRFADARGCGLCDSSVYEIQKTPEEVLEIVKDRRTVDGYNRGIGNGSIIKPDRPVCAECMDVEILEKAETLEIEITIERLKALPEEVLSAWATALVKCFQKLNVDLSPPPNVDPDLSFESDYDCPESERY